MQHNEADKKEEDDKEDPNFAVIRRHMASAELERYGRMLCRETVAVRLLQTSFGFAMVNHGVRNNQYIDELVISST